jgi:LDH2 family malate/lactate/ureidoglycolate dehydrogenase
MPEPAKVVLYHELRKRVREIFVAYAMPAGDADRVAECLLEADLRGIASHGVNRIPIYTRRFRLKLVNPAPALALTAPTPVAAHVHGDNGMGFIVGTRAMAAAIAAASTYGIGFALASHSNHFGIAANYLLQALDTGMASIVLTNASPAMPIWGGRTPFLGTSPLGICVPGGDRQPPLVLDMATAVAARGKIRRAAERGESIPAGWALDEHGRPTTDAASAYRGILLPLAGPKGSGLSLMMEALAGVMSGAAFGGEVKNQYVDFSTPQNVGHFFLAFRPDLFISRDEYRVRMDELVSRAKACPLAEGFEEILMPGEREARLAASRRALGVPVAAEDYAMLAAEETLAAKQ